MLRLIFITFLLCVCWAARGEHARGDAPGRPRPLNNEHPSCLNHETGSPGEGRFVELDKHPEILDELSPQDQPVADRLRRALAVPGLSVTLKIAGKGLSGVFFSTPKCATECSACDVLRKGACGDVISGSSGICGELSVAHVLTDSTNSGSLVDKGWPNIVKGANFDDDFIKRVWKEAGSSAKGTTNGQQKTAIGAKWNNGWYHSCDWDSTPTGWGNVRAWCENITRRMAAGANCVLGLGDGGRDEKSGHSMYAVSAEWTGGQCVVTTLDTGIQGTPKGSNVPRNPGRQTWTIGGPAASPSIRNTVGSNKEFWNGRTYKSTDSYCCQQYEYRYLTAPHESKPGAALQ